jgi:translation initiation factor eIF-2B subunit beta
MYPHEGQDTLQDLASPVPSVLSDYSDLADPLMDDVELVNPLRDYIEPKHVSLYITNVGCFQPSFIYRLLAENYHSDDWESFD